MFFSPPTALTRAHLFRMWSLSLVLRRLVLFWATLGGWWQHVTTLPGGTAGPAAFGIKEGQARYVRAPFGF
eukprot:1177171-Prorocentrum_minimum.AAC.4